MGHTPTPWRVEVDNVFAGPNDRSTYVADCNPMRLKCPDGMVRQTNIESEANAALIVRAVNAHDALIEALEQIAQEAKIANDVIRLGRDDEGSGRVKVATAMHRIAVASDAALLLAKSGVGV